jgi:uncharacterized protein YhaN
MKKTTKTAAKAATKRPRTYKKTDLPRTARAYLGKTYSIHLLKENEAVARLIELYEDRRNELRAEREAAMGKLNARPSFVERLDGSSRLPEKPTLREKFLAWIGAK